MEFPPTRTKAYRSCKAESSKVLFEETFFVDALQDVGFKSPMQKLQITPPDIERSLQDHTLGFRYGRPLLPCHRVFAMHTV